MEIPIEKPASQSTAKRRSKKPKLTTFDKDTLILIRRGTQTAPELATATGVDAAETRKRLSQLEKRKLVSFDAANPERVSLTIKGYNEYSPATLETSSEKKAKKATAKKQAPAQTIQTPPVKPLEPETTQPTQTHPAKEDSAPRIDLSEMLARGAPRNNAAQKTITPHNPTITQQATPVKTQPTPPDPQNKQAPPDAQKQHERCALCKGEFIITVKGDQAKYAHCHHCGAAYHKDCHEAMIADGGACLHCGRKLETVMDKRSYDVVKQLKDAFE